MAIDLPELGALRLGSGELPVLGTSKTRTIAVTDLIPGFAGDIITLLAGDRYREVATAYLKALDGPGQLLEGVPAPPYRHPRKIWGIGLNYQDHADDLAAPTPDEPASFIKADHTIIGYGDSIILPWQSHKVTAEAELGIVMGEYCRNVSEAAALDYVFGVCPILDQTAEDILRRNPRFLTRSKNFPTFFSFGPTVIPMATVLTKYKSLADLEVSTVLNGERVRTNRVGNMIFSVAALISFHSQVMPLFPGDIISTGTPGAVPIQDGDLVECHLGDLSILRNPVSRDAPTQRGEIDTEVHIA
ncbi:MAG: fumarylacetoacetate hydrolase family protein [Candidatus Dormibacteria bacterium]